MTAPKRSPWSTCSAKVWPWCCRNYRVARGPRARGGEIDLILRERDGTVVFVEVRSRAGLAFGGALASVTARKQQRLVLAARHYLAGLARLPPCRFDVVAIDGEAVQWVRGAFERLSRCQPP